MVCGVAGSESFICLV